MENDTDIRRTINAVLTSSPKATSNDTKLGKRIEDALEDFMEGEEIYVKPKVGLHIAELAQKKTKQQKAKAKNKKQQIPVSKTKKISTNDIYYENKDTNIIFSPSSLQRQLSITLKFEKQTYIQTIQIVLNNEIVAQKGVDLDVKAKSTIKLELPPLPLRFYRMLNDCKRITCKLILRDSQPMSLPDIPAATIALTESPIALFVDLGSTYSKMITVTASNSTEEVNLWMKTKLQTLNSYGSTPYSIEKAFAAIGPITTPEFEKYYGLPPFNKEKILDINTDSISAWLANAVSRLAVHFANKGHTLISINWSFPSIQSDVPKHDFNYISKTVTELTQDCLWEQFKLVPEHEALRWRFQHALHRLGSIGKEKNEKQKQAQKQQEKNEIEKKNAKDTYHREKQEFNKKIWLKKIFTKKPEEPDWDKFHDISVPDVANFYQEFIDIGSDKGLEDFFIIDAGGYSLDVFGKVSGSTYGKSFVAGGNEITNHVRNWLNKKYKNIKDISIKEAEIKKCDACRSYYSMNRPLSSECKEQTKLIYTAHVTEALNWLKDCSNNKGLPLILTGGAMANVFLRQLIEGKTKDLGISCKAITSLKISDIVSTDQELQIRGLKKFLEITRGFSDKLSFDMARDVCGGLLEDHLESLNEN